MTNVTVSGIKLILKAAGFTAEAGMRTRVKIDPATHNIEMCIFFRGHGHVSLNTYLMHAEDYASVIRAAYPNVDMYIDAEWDEEENGGEVNLLINIRAED